MNKYLPNKLEMRQAVFTAIAIVLLVLVLGFVGRVIGYTFGFGYSNRWDDARSFHQQGRNMMWKISNDDMNMDDMDMDASDSPMSMDNMMMDMNAGLQGLKGDDLDKEFLKEMIVHHQGAIEMAKTLKAGTKRPELLKMADDIINVQSKEVSMMQGWLDTWFQVKK